MLVVMRSATVLGLGGLLLLGACRASVPAPEPAATATATTAAPPERPRAASPSAIVPPPPASTAASDHQVHALTITVLSTTKAPVGEGEWGFAALVEADGQRILFDTGAKPHTVRHNAEALGLALHSIPTVVLSHHHGDHVGGLLALRRAVSERAPEALATVHVAEGMWAPRRRGTKPREINDMLAIRPAFEATGGTFVTHAAPAELAPGVWVTGPVPRVHPERNWSGSRRLQAADGWGEDTLPESQALVIDTPEGLVVLSGCGHAGIVNIVTHARQRIRAAPVRAAMGGFHLKDASAEHLAWTGERLREVELREFLGAHCTGAAAVRRFGAEVVPPEGRAAELGVGGRFTLGGAQ